MEVGVGGGRQRHGGESHTRNQGLASESQGTPPLRCLSWSLTSQGVTRMGVLKLGAADILHGSFSVGRCQCGEGCPVHLEGV